MELKKATKADCEFIALLFNNDEYEMYFSENSTTAEEWSERFGYFYKEENFIIYDKGNPLGWLTYIIENDVCHIGIIIVKYELIGSGIGYQAFNQAISSLPSTVKKVMLDVQQRNKHAVSFYKRYGFKIVGEEVHPVGDGTQLYFNMELNRENDVV